MHSAMRAKERAEILLFRHGLSALCILLHDIETAVSAHNDVLALELDDVLQEVERWIGESGENWPHHFPFVRPTLH